MLQVAEHSAPIEQRKYLPVKLALSLVHQMVDRKAGNHRIKLTEHRKWVVEIVAHQGDGRVVGEAAAGGFEHRRGEINRHGFGLGAIKLG